MLKFFEKYNIQFNVKEAISAGASSMIFVCIFLAFIMLLCHQYIFALLSVLLVVACAVVLGGIG